VTTRQLFVKRSFPVRARADPSVLVEVEKDFFESKVLERRSDFAGYLLVVA
jgi:hypothetical protein